MCKEKSTTILQGVPENLSGWDKAIYDTEQKILATKARLSRLKAARNLFKEQKSSGEPFPGEDAEQAASEAA